MEGPIPEDWDNIFGTDDDSEPNLDVTPPLVSSHSNSQPPPRISRADEEISKGAILVQTYSAIQFTKEELSGCPIDWWTNTSRSRAHFQEVMFLIDPSSMLRDLSLATLSTPSGSASAERLFSLMGMTLQSRHSLSASRMASMLIF